MTREEAAERAHDTLCLRRPGGPEEDEAPATEREESPSRYREQTYELERPDLRAMLLRAMRMTRSDRDMTDGQIADWVIQEGP